MSHDAERRFEETAVAVAHELATPLAVAQAAVDALSEHVDDEEGRVLLDAAARGLRSMDLQVGRLRRLDPMGGDDVETRPVDLVKLASELLADLETALLQDHPTRLDAPDELIAAVDPDQLRQVLYNLLSNAARYSPPGREVAVTITSDDDQFVLRVQDRGHGVAPEDAERIFDRYERASDRGAGVGLGLYLSRRVVEAHGGTLGVRPAEGEGSIFELTLPRGTATQA